MDLNDLLGGNPALPQAPNYLPETEWKLLQYNPNSNGNSGILHNQQQLGNGSHAVVRHYEHYKYTGAYDPLTHQALCIDPTCLAPGAGELGDQFGAQNAASNIEVPSITVAKDGSGTVTGDGSKINCGGTCFATIAGGTTISLTAQPPSNGVFNFWSDACAGQPATCSLTVNSALSTTAKFTTVYTVSIGRSGNGSVTGSPNGEFSTLINCGSSCSGR